MALDAQQVDRKRADLEKAIKGNESSTVILALLTDLRKGIVASDKLLRDTKIGVAVNRLKTYKDPAVAKLAAGMVTQWKQEMQAQKQKQLNSGSSTPKPAVNGLTSSPAQSSPAPPVKQEKKKYEGNTATRTAKQDSMEDTVKCTGNPVRDGCLILMYNGLAFLSEEGP